MRLLRVIRRTNLESGGPIEGLIRTSEVLQRHGHHVEIVSLEEPSEIAGRALPFPVHALGSGVGRYGFNARLVPWLRRNAGRFDLVIVHGLWNYSSWGTWRALRKSEIPYYIYTHGMLDPWFREQYPVKHILKQMFWLAAEGRVLRDAQAVLFTSEEERLRARHVFWGHTYRERVVLYGTADPIDALRLEANQFLEAYPHLASKRLLLFISRIHPKKGCELLLEGFARNVAELPEDLDLVIAGPDQAGLACELKKLAEERGIASRVHWPGMLQNQMKWGVFLAADALILPSHQENFGIAVAEAMACSKPVLISNKVNIWREVEAAGAGLVEPDTADGAENLIRRFYALSAGQQKAMGEAARACFLSNFQIDAVARDLLRVLGCSDVAETSSPGVIDSAISAAGPASAEMRGRRLRVLHVIRTTDPESGEPLESLLQFSRLMVRGGHTVEVVSLEDPAVARDHRLPFPVTGLGPGRGRYGFNWDLERWLRLNASRFDAVIVHGVWNHTSAATRRALRNSPIPYFVFTHGMLDPWFRQAYPVKHLAKLAYWYLQEGPVLRDAHRVLFTCKEEMVRAREDFPGHYRGRVVLFGTSEPPAVDARDKQGFYERFPGLWNRRFLLFMGRIHPKKGCDILLEAFARSLRFIPPDVDLLIAGPDQVNLVRQLKKLADELEIEDRIHWVGMVSGSVKWSAFRDAEALVLPSHQENFGIVVAESMACATPVLISDKVNIWREVQDSGGGLVAPDTIAGTFASICRFFAFPQEERAAMRLAARVCFKTHFDMEVAVKDLVSVLDVKETGSRQ